MGIRQEYLQESVHLCIRLCVQVRLREYLTVWDRVTKRHCI